MITEILRVGSRDCNEIPLERLFDYDEGLLEDRTVVVAGVFKNCGNFEEAARFLDLHFAFVSVRGGVQSGLKCRPAGRVTEGILCRRNLVQQFVGVTHG